jgi:hypothetical protein
MAAVCSFPFWLYNFDMLYDEFRSNARIGVSGNERLGAFSCITERWDMVISNIRDEFILPRISFRDEKYG